MPSRRCSALILLGVAVPSASHARPAPPPTLANGIETYQASHVEGDVRCDGAPLVLAGSHTSLRLYGDCRQVRVEGEHNDILVQVPPGAVIETTGAHNDVTWTAARRSTRPVLLDRGSRNSFHHADR